MVKRPMQELTSIDNIGASFGTGQHRSDTSAGRIVSVDVNRHVRECTPQFTHQQRGGPRLQQASHVLDVQDVSARAHDLLSQLHVVVKIILAMFVRVAYVARVAAADEAMWIHFQVRKNRKKGRTKEDKTSE